MWKRSLIFIVGALIFSGCNTTNNVSGEQFVRIATQRNPGEKIVLKRKGGYFYADRIVMPPTKSLFEHRETFRTSTNNLSPEQFDALVKKVEAEKLFPN